MEACDQGGCGRSQLDQWQWLALESNPNKGSALTSNVGELGQQAVEGRHVQVPALSFLIVVSP